MTTHFESGDDAVTTHRAFMRFCDDIICARRPAQLQKAEEITGDLLKQGVISESSSNFNAPIVMVAKKTGETRMYLDLRALNAIITP